MHYPLMSVYTLKKGLGLKAWAAVIGVEEVRCATCSFLVILYACSTLWKYSGKAYVCACVNGNTILELKWIFSLKWKVSLKGSKH